MSSTSTTTTRREFAAAALAAGAAALLPAACASGSATTAAGTPPAAEPNARVADALMAAVLARHGQWLDGEQRGNVRQAIERNLRLADRLRAVPLPNSADPYSVCYAPPPPPPR